MEASRSLAASRIENIDFSFRLTPFTFDPIWIPTRPRSLIQRSNSLIAIFSSCIGNVPRPRKFFGYSSTTIAIWSLINFETNNVSAGFAQ